MCVLIFYTTFEQKISNSKQNCVSYGQKYTLVFKYKVNVILVRF